MATEPSPNFMTQLLNALMLNINGKGGSSASDFNLLGNDNFAALTGTASDPPELTEEQAYQQFMPTMFGIAQGDPNSIEGNILGAMNDGNSVVQMKRDILAQGLLTQEEKLYLDLIDTLDKERNEYTKYQRTPKVDSFTKMGLPHASERFVPEDFAPDAFQGALKEWQSAKTGVDKRLATIDSQFTNPTPTLTAGTEKGPSTLQGINNILLGSGMKWDGKSFDANIEALKSRPQDRPLLEILNGSPKEWNQSAFDALNESFTTRNTRKENVETQKQDKRTRDIRRQYAMEMAGAPITAAQGSIGDGANITRHQATNVRDPVASQERILALISQKIATGMDESGYTPTNIALLKRLLAAKGSKNG